MAAQSCSNKKASAGSDCLVRECYFLHDPSCSHAPHLNVHRLHRFFCLLRALLFPAPHGARRPHPGSFRRPLRGSEVPRVQPAAAPATRAAARGGAHRRRSERTVMARARATHPTRLFLLDPVPPSLPFFQVRCRVTIIPFSENGNQFFISVFLNLIFWSTLAFFACIFAI